MKIDIQFLTTFTFVLKFGTAYRSSDVGLSPIEIIQNHGYSSETHYITTEDGYVLTFYRIPSRNKPSVLLVHGMSASTAEYVNSGNNSVAFMLADSGYDVWLGNCRGNAFSRNHTTLNVNTDKQRFYDFSWHEIGYFDLPAAIDYILELKNESRLYYIGMSQGTTAFFVMASLRPNYNNKIRLAHMLAPTAFMKDCPNQIIASLANKFNQIAQLANQLQIYEVPNVDLFRRIGPHLCSHSYFRIFCRIMFDLLLSSEYLDTDYIPVFLTNYPSNTAIKQLAHYAQIIRTGIFQQFDYGPKRNLKFYGTKVPPVYNISRITSPVALYYGIGDTIQAFEGVITLKAQLPNIVLDYVVPRKSFNHFDFILATDLRTLVYNKLLEINEKY